MNRPEGETMIATPMLSPVKVEGSDGTIWMASSVLVWPNWQAVTVECSSLMTHAHGSRGWKSMWRRPALDLVFANGGSAGANLSVAL
jgi:hypothetical protein